jgi:fused signal recognition particle receptor
MDNPWREPKVLGPLAGAGALALICLIGWAIASSHEGKVSRELADTRKTLDETADQLKRAKHDADAATDYVEQVKKQRDEQTAARKKAEDAVVEAQKAAKASDDARNDAEAKADRARRDADKAETDRKTVAADRDHQYELRQQIQQQYDDVNKQLQQAKQAAAVGEGPAKK